MANVGNIALSGLYLYSFEWKRGEIFKKTPDGVACRLLNPYWEENNVCITRTITIVLTIFKQTIINDHKTKQTPLEAIKLPQNPF